MEATNIENKYKNKDCFKIAAAEACSKQALPQKTLSPSFSIILLDGLYKTWLVKKKYHLTPRPQFAVTSL